MADYSVDIQASLKGFEKLDEYERKINELSNKKVQVQFDAKGIDNLLKGVEKTKLSTSPIANNIFNINDLKKQGKLYYSKVRNTLEKMQPDIEKTFRSKGFSDISVAKGVEDATGKIKSFTVTAKDASGVLKQFEFQRQKLVGSGKAQDGFLQTNDIKVLKTAIEQGKKETESFYKKYNSLQNKFSNTNSNFGNLKSNISSAGKSNLGEYAYDQLASKINKAEQALANFNAESTKGSNANLDSMNASLKEFNTLTTSASKQYEKLMQPVDRLSQNKMLNDFKSYWNENTKAHKDFSPDYESIVSELENTKLTSGRSSELKKQIASFKSEIKSSGKEGKSWISDTKRALGQIAQFTGVYAALQNIMVELPSQMIDAVKDVDAAKIELTKVSDAPTSQLSDYWNEAAESAKKYGATISDVISSTASWSRLGYNLQDSKYLSDMTTLYQKVGDNMTQESASENLISTLQGFKLKAKDAGSIVDRINEVSNTQPINTSQLGEALKRSASSFNAAHTDLSSAIALITGTFSVTQDASRTGNMWKTVSMRLRSEDTRDKILDLIGYDIMNKQGTGYKDIMKIITDIGGNFSGYSDKTQAKLLDVMGGKNNGNALAAALNNSDLIKQAYNTAEFGSEGSAEKELSNYRKSIEYDIGQMKASFQELSTTAVSSDVFKGFIDGGTTAINVLTKFISVANGVPAVLTAIGAVKAFKNLD